MRRALWLLVALIIASLLVVTVTPLRRYLYRARLAARGTPFTAEGFAQCIDKDDAPGIDLFCRAGQSANAPINGTSPLMLAVTKRRLAAAKALLGPGCAADVNALSRIVGIRRWSDTRKWTPLTCAMGDLRLVRLLLAHGADPNKANEIGFNALVYASSEPNAVTLLDEFFRAGATSDAAQAALTAAIKRGDTRPEVLDRLVRGGASVFADDYLVLLLKENTVDRSELDVARWLVARGADAKTSAALPSAARQGSPEMVRLLLVAGAQANSVADGTFTALHMVVAQSDRTNERIAVVEMLVKAGADINARLAEPSESASRGWMLQAQPLRGTTPLLLCAKLNCAPSIALALLNAGAEIDAQDAAGFNSLHYAKGDLRDHLQIRKVTAHLAEVARSVDENRPTFYRPGDRICINLDLADDEDASYCGVVDARADDRYWIKITQVNINCGWLAFMRCGAAAQRCTGNARLMKYGSQAGDVEVGEHIWVPHDCVE